MSNTLPIPEVQEVREPSDFDRIVVQAQAILASLKPLDYDALYDELRDLNVPTSENPHIQQLNSDLQTVQAAKDRVSEISTDIMRHAQTYRRVADLLTEGWVRFSDQSGADKRKADAQLKMSQFEHLATEAESLHKTSLGILKNLDSKHEATSRQITCVNLMLKLRDVGRTTGDAGFLPDDFTDYAKPRVIPQPESFIEPTPPAFVPEAPIGAQFVTPPQVMVAPVIPPVPTSSLPIQSSESLPLQPVAEISQVSPSKDSSAWDAFSRG